MSASAVDPRSPCIVGVAQRTVRPPEGPAPEPLESWVEMATAAAADAGAPNVLPQLDSVQIVYCQSWQYDDPIARFCERTGAAPRHQLYSGIGGTTPQVLVNDVAEAMLRGELDTALVVGAEALATKRALKKAGEKPEWSFKDPERKPFPFEAMPHEAEIAHDVFQAWLTFPLFDVARRAQLGAGLSDYAASIGAMMAPMTDVAAKSPHAWFPVARSATELVTATPDNRYVGWPYTKWTVSVMDVDMAAAAIVMTHEAADRFGVPADKRVYLRGWAYGTDCWYVAERDEMWRSRAMEATSRSALASAGASIDDVAHFDLYSCFASSLHLACDALGIAPTDPRGLTVTGGLPFAGGPASNYMLHSIATMTEVLREGAGSLGVVSGVGMHMTKHAYGAYSTSPGPSAPTPPGDLGLTSMPKREMVSSYDGPARVVTYTVAHQRDGSPDWGLIVGEIDGGRRIYAKVTDPALMADAESRELVDSSVTVSSDGKVNTAGW
ncbi:MAG: acetyl-CoA acetyltransferase [Actinomycetes bacterium]